jgi:uncharacterized membrane protein
MGNLERGGNDMAEATKSRRRGRGAAEQVQQQTEDTKDQAQDTVSDAQEQASGVQDQVPGAGGDGQPTLVSELRETIRDAALEVLRPVAREATKSAAKMAATKGPDLVKDKVVPKVIEAGGPGALAKGALDKGGGLAGGIGGLAGNIGEKLGGGKKEGKKPTGHGRGRRLPVQEFVDVAVDIDTAYDQFTQFEDFPNFMHRVEKIEQKDDTTLMWHENIWGVRRSWEAEIIDQQPPDRIAWRSKGQVQVVGVVTFHRLSDNLTRVYVNMDFQPKGLFEKTASGFRMSRRALRSDLMRFKAFTEMKNDPTGAWRGRIEDSEVVEEDQERDEAEDEPRDEEEEEFEEEEEEPSAEDEDEEPSAEEEDEEPSAEEEEYEEEEPEEEPEEEEPPKPKKRPRKRAPAKSR